MQNQQTIDARWMAEAISLARHAATLGEVPVGAILIDANNAVIGRGYNHPISSSDPTAHAEIMALREGAKTMGNYRLPGTTLYVTIEPCSMCAGAMVHARIDRLVFAAVEPKAGAVVSKAQVLNQPHSNHHIAVTAGVLEKDASELISGFFANKRAEKKQTKDL